MPYVERTDQELFPFILKAMKLHPAPLMNFFQYNGKRISAQYILYRVALGDTSLLAHYADNIRQGCRRDDSDPLEVMAGVISALEKAAEGLEEDLKASRRLIKKIKKR